MDDLFVPITQHDIDYMRGPLAPKRPVVKDYNDPWLLYVDGEFKQAFIINSKD